MLMDFYLRMMRRSKERSPPSRQPPSLEREERRGSLQPGDQGERSGRGESNNNNYYYC